MGISYKHKVEAQGDFAGHPSKHYFDVVRFMTKLGVLVEEDKGQVVDRADAQVCQNETDPKVQVGANGATKEQQRGCDEEGPTADEIREDSCEEAPDGVGREGEECESVQVFDVEEDDPKHEQSRQPELKNQ